NVAKRTINKNKWRYRFYQWICYVRLQHCVDPDASKIICAYL
ncbi:MAG: hypothetical protein Dasosvirus5_17, partial [Dasosvirus sp.]